jgi:hypothetical protein
VPNVYIDKAEELRLLLVSIDNRLSNIEQQGGYVHTQSVAATQWIVIHNLGRSPGIFVEDNSGNIIEFDRSDPNFTTTLLNFTSAITGKAVCS